MENPDVQYVTDSEGREVGVIVPIALWREISAREYSGAVHFEDKAPEEPIEQAGEPTATERTRIGTNDVSGLPVFITPPGAKKLTLEDVQAFESEW